MDAAAGQTIAQDLDHVRLANQSGEIAGAPLSSKNLIAQIFSPEYALTCRFLPGRQQAQEVYTSASPQRSIWPKLVASGPGKRRKRSTSLKEYLFSLGISAEEYLRYYQGQAVAVVVTDSLGRTIRFPANALRSHVAHNGVHGRFRLITDDEHKLQRLERIG
jgi:hypothetical protein